MDCISVTSVLVVGLLTLLAYRAWKSWELMRTFKKLGIPGPPPRIFVGNTMQIGKLGFRETLAEWGKQYGKIFGAFFPGPTITVSDPEVLRDLFIKKFADFPNRNANAFNSYKPWSDTLLSLRDDHWRHVRNQLSPTFSSGKLKKMMPAISLMIGNLHKHIQKKADTGEEVELREMAGCYTMDTIAGAGFGMHVDSLANPDDPFNVNGRAIMKQNLPLMYLLINFPWLAPALARFGISFVPHKPTQFFLDIVDAALKDRRKDQQSHSDFLQLLVDADKEGEEKGSVDAEIDHTADLQTAGRWTQKGLTDEEKKANAMLFFLAGFDTTSIVLSFSLFDLANNPDALKKAQEEVDQKLGKTPVRYDTAADLTYLDMCMNESMRLMPPGFVLDREAVVDTDLAGYPLKKGTRVMIPVYSIHRDPEHWPEPEKFIPERHTPEAKAARNAFVYLPFGHGPRNCIGMRLAQLEIRMALATILQHYTPVPVPKSVYPPRLTTKEVRMVAQDGLWVKFESRA